MAHRKVFKLTSEFASKATYYHAILDAGVSE